MGRVFTDTVNEAYQNALPGTTLRHHFQYGLTQFSLQSLAMRRGSSIPWWWEPASILPVDTMTYECDTKLGRPRPLDCSQLEYSQLGDLSDTITIEPGNITFINSVTCNVAISAAEPIVLSWEQIKITLDTLINVCVSNPFSASVGGRAFYGVQSPLKIGGRKGKKKRGVSGLNALPPAANVTLFQQFERFANPLKESTSCTWQHVLDGKDVRLCRNAHFLPPRPAPRTLLI